MSIYDLKTNIFLQANDFYETYRRCRKGENPRKDEYGRTVYSVVNIPAIVNGVFAIELYIKNILRNKAKGHELKILFNKLDNDIKKEIREKAISVNDLNWKKDFDGYFEELSNTFVEWRYIFEKEHTECFYGERINRYLQVLEIILPVFQEVSSRYNDSDKK